LKRKQNKEKRMGDENFEKIYCSGNERGKRRGGLI
jgi:hypothetical protein